jgi:Ca2+-binding RTX toxin-like protein
MDLSGTVIGPDGVGVRIYWTFSGDAPFDVNTEHLVLNGMDNIIGGVQWYTDTYDYYSGIILTNGNDDATGESFGDRSFSFFYGLGGNDTLYNAYYMDGGDGNDTIYANQDGMTLVGGNGDDSLVAYDFDHADGGEGTDTITYAVGGTDPLTFNLAAGTISGGGIGNITLTGIENVNGTEGNNLIIGTAGVNVLHGWGGDDTLRGGGGADTLDGGDGFDTADYSTSAAAVTVDLSAHTAAGGDAQGDQLSNIEAVAGSAYADTLTGDAGANTLSGNAGNDVLVGGAGADHLDGGDGVDRADYSGSAAGVTVNLETNVNTGGDAAGDVLTGIETLGGSNFADSLTGDAGTNTLWGHDGDDLLSGGAGNDSLYGESGADTLVGGDGDDNLIGGAGADHLDGGIGTDVANYGNAAGGVTLSLVTGGTGGEAAGDSYVAVENVIGSGFDDVIQGDAGANAISGLAGADHLYGGLGNDTLGGGAGDDSLYGEGGADRLDGGDGNDTLIGGAGADVLVGGAGIDVANYSASAVGVTVNLATGTGSGGDAAGDTYSGVENVLGSAQADTLTGDAGANSLWGLDGNDVLTGGAGADVLKGGIGADTFVYKSIADSTVAVAGRDSINDFSHAEGDRIDLGQIDADGNAGNGNTAFTFLGTGAFTGAGHELHLVISGGVQLVQADVNGDKVADMSIVVLSASTLVAGDFVL